VPFDVNCPEPLQNFLHRPGFALMNMGVKNSVNNTIRKKCNRKVPFSRRQQPEMFANAEHDAPETFRDALKPTPSALP
jgi:hypothetical protein